MEQPKYKQPKYWESDKKKYKMLVQKIDPDKVLRYSLDYHTSIKNVCVMLQSSRVWVDKYIRPHIPYIYTRSTANNQPDNTRNPIKTVQNIEKIGSTKDAIRFHTESLYQFLIANMTLSRRTIVYPLENLIDEDNRADFIEAYNLAVSKEKKKDYAEDYYASAYQFMSDMVYDILCNPPQPTKRTTVQAIEIPTESMDMDTMKQIINTMKTVSDRKNYGDTDEIVYRDMFRSGAIRCELKIPDENGDLSERVYYYVPETPETKTDLVLLRYEDYLKIMGNAV